jgi:YD repeat-containing protein
MVNNKLRAMLKNNPNFVLKEELVEQDFARYYEKFKLWPFINISLRGGFSLPNYNVDATYSVLDGVDYEAPYNASLQTILGGSLEIFPIRNLSLNGELNYAKYDFSREVGTDQAWRLEYEEELDLWEFNLYLKKYFTIKGFDYQPYIFGGIYMTQMVEASGDIKLTYDAVDKLTNTTDNNDISTTSIDRLADRNEFNQGIMMGLGFNRKIQNFMVGMEGRYYTGANNIMSVRNRYRNQELVFNYYYVDNDVTVDKLELAIKIGYIFRYNIHKKKN